MCKRILFITLLATITIFARAQFLDSLNLAIGTEGRLSSKDHQPFWLIANKYGTVADIGADLGSYIRFSNTNVLAEHEYTNGDGFTGSHTFTFSYGASIYNNNHFRSFILEQAYGKIEYKNWSLRGGRFEETIGDIDPELSTGSLGVSANALPIPKIGLAVTDYTNVPFTKGWLQFRGSFAHGWLGDERYIKNSYYHEKTFFLRVGPRKLKVYAGIEHFVEWGGNVSEEGPGKGGFMDALFAKETSDGHGGDQRGVLDGGAYWENENFKVHFYLQKPFEGKHDIGFGTKNVLGGLQVNFKDRYIGIQKVMVELISTDDIDGDVPVNQLESYYNNSVYKTGWEYHNSVIGTPLFINRVRANKYFPEIVPFDWNGDPQKIPGNANIVNNRIFGLHFGMTWSITGQLDGKTLLTYTKNYGSLADPEPFFSHRNQFYSLQQFTYDIDRSNIMITAAIAIDAGQMSKTMIGGLLGIEWNINGRKNTDEYY